MLETKDILETINMIDNEDLDVRTITMGISLLDCMDNDIDKACQKVYDKVCYSAKDLVKTGMDIESEYGIPIINKRVSVTPIGMVAAPCKNQDITKFAKTLDKAADTLGINFIGGYSALVQKGFASGDMELIKSIPEALATTEKVCSSVNIGSTKAGINMDAVKIMGQIVKDSAELTKDKDRKLTPASYLSAYWKLFKQCHEIWKKYRPKVIISTGSNIAVPLCFIAKFH